MTKFEDQLFGQLMAEHGHRLRAVEQPAPTRRRVRRPVWLATGAAGAVAAVTAAVMAFGSAPASAAYSVTRHDNGTVTVAVSRPSGLAGANVALHAMGARVVVVPVRPGCPPIASLPRPQPAPHPSVSVGARVSKNGARDLLSRHRDPGRLSRSRLRHSTPDAGPGRGVSSPQRRCRCPSRAGGGRPDGPGPGLPGRRSARIWCRRPGGSRAARRRAGRGPRGREARAAPAR